MQWLDAFSQRHAIASEGRMIGDEQRRSRSLAGSCRLTAHRSSRWQRVEGLFVEVCVFVL